MASVNTARNPTVSTNGSYFKKRYIMKLQIAIKQMVASIYDWKSVHCQKCCGSKSENRMKYEN